MLLFDAYPPFTGCSYESLYVCCWFNPFHIPGGVGSQPIV
jgi:hypothetical protein